jgi:chloramphenicol 3-O phosphotransferase
MPDRVRQWDRAVHSPGMYDLEVETSILSPDECFQAIEARLAVGPGTAFAQAAAALGRNLTPTEATLEDGDRGRRNN